jgi:hypothetical protein
MGKDQNRQGDDPGKKENGYDDTRKQREQKLPIDSMKETFQIEFQQIRNSDSINTFDSIDQAAIDTSDECHRATTHTGNHIGRSH